MSALCWSCRRCMATFTTPCENAEAEIERRIRERDLYTTHSCQPAMFGEGRRGGGAVGIAEILGEAERPRQEPTT